MTIKLRVVGIFYSTEVEVPEGQTGMVVRDVMDAAVAKLFEDRPDRRSGLKLPGKQRLSYEALRNGNMSSPSRISAEYTEDFSSENKSYKAGLYPAEERQFFDAISGNIEAYAVWQYYIFDGGGVLKSNNNAFVPFDDPEAFVEDEGSVLWRLVVVRQNSVEATMQGSQRYEAMLTS
ncbi:MAG: hypothetical protein AAFN09_03955 [Pseudomonadota bacterium]